eukprot:3052545-Prorocentrum_lima.AAC.1
MQFGFRQNRSAARALSCVRRVAEQGERTGSPTYLLLLDWKMAFDKVTHSAITEKSSSKVLSPLPSGKMPVSGKAVRFHHTSS